MRRIDFDRDASLMGAASLRRLLRGAGFVIQPPVEYLFVFPRALRWLRPLEPPLRRMPLGAQYLVVGRRR
jgi:hypothetical protein